MNVTTKHTTRHPPGHMESEMTTFYINGEQVSKQTAKHYLDRAAMNQGYEPENYESAWKAVGRSEESREFINEVSGYALEIIVD